MAKFLFWLIVLGAGYFIYRGKKEMKSIEEQRKIIDERAAKEVVDVESEVIEDTENNE